MTRTSEFRAGNPRPKQQRSEKWTARKKLLRSDRYADWTPQVPFVGYPTPGRGAQGESSTGIR